MPVRPSTAFVAGALTALVLGTGTAYAATGGTFVLGRANSATTTTTLTNYGGSAMYLRSKLGTPPFLVNRTTKVPLLNSDAVDGLDGSQLALAAPRIGTVTAFGRAFPAATTPYKVWAIATCPAGSQVVGGGGIDPTGNNLFWSAPGDAQDWMVVSSTTDTTPENAIKVEAYARCWNPRASVPDSSGQTPASAARSATARTMERRLGR